MSSQPDNLARIFDEAVDLQNSAERAAYLDAACGQDAGLRADVEQLLKHDDAAGSFLDRADPPGLVATLDDPITERPGTIIGPYKLLEQIGEGGFGVVFMAEQQHPVRRKVALKVIKPGMDTRQVIARFEAERQALALMDHPNIARVFDGGETTTGRPYFVMELVRGIPITDFCDQNLRSVRQRLELFVTVCQAVQHAHQKGIIHRDLKPTNMMVTMHDDKPVVKVIDFGIVKATGQQLTEKTLFTNFAQMIGTPLYMSPEQAQMSGLDVDTRSDIYSLGVLLYELLTGMTPFDKERLKQAGFDEIRRIIREEEPLKPSTRMSTVGQAATMASEKRQSDPRKLSRLFRGELDWIVMRALEKDRNRRYETASAFGADVERYLKDEAVQACPPSAMYRLRKFARRNKGPVLATSLILLCLIGGIIGTSWGMVWAIEAENATRGEVIEKDKATKEAQEQAAIATSISESLKQMLGSLNPDAAKGPDYTARQLLDDYADNLEAKLTDLPEAAADLHLIIGRAYACLDQRDKAKQHLERALVLRRGIFGEQHEKYADVLVEHARPDAWESEAELRRALAIYRERGVGGAPVIRALYVLQWLLTGQARSATFPTQWNEVEALWKEALAEADKFPGQVFSRLPALYRGCAAAKMARGQYAEGEAILREAIAMGPKFYGPDSYEFVWGYFSLAYALRHQHKFSEAIKADKQALAIMRRALPPGHRAIAWALTAALETLNGAAKAHTPADPFPSVAEWSEWEAVFHEVLRTTNPSKLNEDDPALMAGRALLRSSGFYWDRSHELASAGKTKEAEEARRKAILLLESLQTELAGIPDLIDDVHNYLAWFLATAELPAHRDPARAVALAQKAAESRPWLSDYRNTLGVARYRAGDWKQAISDLEKSVSLAEGNHSYNFFFLAMAHWQLGHKEEARKWYDQAMLQKNQETLPTEKSGGHEIQRFQGEAAALLGVKEKKE